MGLYVILLLITIILQSYGFKLYLNGRVMKILSTGKMHISDTNTPSDEAEITIKAMASARKNQQEGLSPGAGLPTAEEQAEAAYADLINTTIDQRGLGDLSSEELAKLNKAGKMWEPNAKTKKKSGLFDDLVNIFGALAGGAHIEKNKFGET
eukprot:gene17207-23708_t